ncbi:protein disulfide oxidoreductase [Neisseria brasiliensis]|nr:protein disulfide oxidoreductase [Neisseria brasiliensis]
MPKTKAGRAWPVFLAMKLLTMSRTLLSYLKSFLQAALIFALISIAIDWWRKPNQPIAFAEQNLITLNQNHTSLNQLSQDRVAIVYFWGTWCGICKYTSPTVEKLHQNHIPVISIALKSGDDTALQQYLNQNQLSFPTVNDSDGLIAQQWDINVTPTIVFVKKGQMLHATTGISSYWGLRLRMLISNLMY